MPEIVDVVEIQPSPQRFVLYGSDGQLAASRIGCASEIIEFLCQNYLQDYSFWLHCPDYTIYRDRTADEVIGIIQSY